MDTADTVSHRSRNVSQSGTDIKQRINLWIDQFYQFIKHLHGIGWSLMINAGHARILKHSGVLLAPKYGFDILSGSVVDTLTGIEYRKENKRPPAYGCSNGYSLSVPIYYT